MDETEFDKLLDSLYRQAENARMEAARLRKFYAPQITMGEHDNLVKESEILGIASQLQVAIANEREHWPLFIGRHD